MQHQLVSEQLQVLVNSLGAELCSVKNKQGLEFIWQGDKEVWARHAPVLFPIVGKLKNNQYVKDGTAYELAQHGFARDMDFKLLHGDGQSCLWRLSASAETKNKFPFDFIFDIEHRLEGNVLRTEYSVENPSGTEELLFSVGAHPGFNCPLLPGEKMTDYYLAFEKEGLEVTTLNAGLRSSTKIPLPTQAQKLSLSAQVFDKDALVFENGQINKISLCSAKSPHQVSLSCEGWPFFGIWSKKDNDRFICLEPWYGIADHENADQQLAHKQGIIRLRGGNRFRCSFSVTFT